MEDGTTTPQHTHNWQFACQLREDEMSTYLSEDTLTIKMLSKRNLPYVKKATTYKLLFFCTKGNCGVMKTALVSYNNTIQGVESVPYNL